MSEIKYGFAPVFDKASRLLILGSFPSVKSRKIEFYYGNPQNRFWRVVCSYFGESVPQTVDGKKSFLLKHNIALWDIVTECEITGSQDDTIKNFKVADLKTFLQNCAVRYIILNGSTAFMIFKDNYGGLDIPYVKLPSTSPANTRFDEKEWFDALSSAFNGT
ncbi:MAG: DNA-deoxyinosine glycosylase [Clostridia bacterium]|nr:DNA-deoxyinosine glycosylase [Clostridia bacterium]